MTSLPDGVPRARRLRRDSSDVERALWRALRAKRLTGFKFRRQQPIGPYIVDFVSFQIGLVIEVDGGQHDEQAQRRSDEARTLWLNSRGLRVLRFWNNEVLTDQEAVLETIWQAVTEAAAGIPSPLTGEG